MLGKGRIISILTLWALFNSCILYAQAYRETGLTASEISEYAVEEYINFIKNNPDNFFLLQGEVPVDDGFGLIPGGTISYYYENDLPDNLVMVEYEGGVKEGIAHKIFLFEKYFLSYYKENIRGESNTTLECFLEGDEIRKYNLKGFPSNFDVAQYMRKIRSNCKKDVYF